MHDPTEEQLHDSAPLSENPLAILPELPEPVEKPLWFREQNSFIMNTHGIIGIAAIGLMIAFAFLHQWDIDWPYFVIAMAAYSIVLISHSLSKESSSDIRLLIGCHIAFLLLAGGMWFRIEGFWEQLGIFASAVAAGLAMPFLPIRKAL